MLIRLGLMEQRHKAVLEVLAGHPVTKVALRYGVARQTVHVWLRRYAASGIGALLLRIVVDDTIEPMVEVTAYQTSGVDKYRREDENLLQS